MTAPITFQIDVEKSLNGEFWSNRYYTQAGSISIAAQDAPGFATAERFFHGDVVTFTKVRVSTLTPNDNQFIVIPLNLQGSFSTDTGLLPLFNVVRVDFQAGFGRPYRKYYRGCLSEGVVSGSVITNTAFAAAVEQAMTGLFGANFTREGEQLGEGVLSPRVAMRQLRRGSRRRQTPILPI